MGRAFRIMDSNGGNRKVDAREFFDGLNDFGVNVSKAEADALMGYFDTDGDGSINFDEFLVGVRGRMNNKRKALCDKAFLKFDKDGNGFIEAADLKGSYNCSFHPKVISGEMTED